MILLLGVSLNVPYRKTLMRLYINKTIEAILRRIKIEKIAVLSVYYGKLPPYYRLWIKSCEYNPTIDFYLVTDIPVTDLPTNVSIIKLSLEQFRKLAEDKLETKISLEAPYKICDYRPMFGQIFQDYLSGYDYWANCDMDMIFGDLRKFFDMYDLSQYDRFLHLGHLSLYRNTPKCNLYYRLPGSHCGDWKKVVESPQNCLFDEWNGIFGIYHENNIPMFEQRIFADISMIYTRFRLALDDKNYDQQVFYWEDGHVYRSYWEDEQWKREEFIYIHFKRRKMDKEAFSAKNTKAFFIGPNGFQEKTQDISVNTIDEINPFRGEKFEHNELKKFHKVEKKEQWKRKLNRLLGRKK